MQITNKMVYNLIYVCYDKYLLEVLYKKWNWIEKDYQKNLILNI